MQRWLKNSIKEDVQERRDRIGRLDRKVVEFSEDLVRDEVKNHAIFIDNEYFLKISDPVFHLLSAPEQLVYLALSHLDRGRSVPGYRFSFQCQKEIDGIVVDFALYLDCVTGSAKSAVLFDGSEEKQRQLERTGYFVMNYTTAEVWQKPLEIAEEMFLFLDDKIEKTGYG